MATVEDYKRLEDVRKARQKAKSEGKNIPAALSNGKEYNRKAIASVRNAGIWLLISSIFTMVLLVAVSIMALIRSGGEDTETVLNLISNTLPVYIVPIYMLIVGAKIASLNATPRFVLANLIISLVLCLLSVSGIISMIFIIIAMTKYSIYRNWFYDIG